MAQVHSCVPLSYPSLFDQGPNADPVVPTVELWALSSVRVPRGLTAALPAALSSGFGEINSSSSAEAFCKAVPRRVQAVGVAGRRGVARGGRFRPGDDPGDEGGWFLPLQVSS